MPRPRKRRVVSEWRRKRDRMARARGYRDYYDYRLHGSGRTPPDAAPPPEGERARRRGHAGRADFLRHIKPGYTVSLLEPVSTIETVLRRRRKKTRTGRYMRHQGRFVWETVKVFPRIEKLVLDNGGEARTFTLRNLSHAELRETIREEQRRGAVFLPLPSLDQRSLVRGEE